MGDEKEGNHEIKGMIEFKYSEDVELAELALKILEDAINRAKG